MLATRRLNDSPTPVELLYQEAYLCPINLCIGAFANISVDLVFYGMGRPKREVLATAREASTPPLSLPDGHLIARVVKAEGNNIYSVECPSAETLLVELPSRFRSTIWIKRGGYVVVDTDAFANRANKLAGEIVNVVLDEKQWRKEPYW